MVRFCGAMQVEESTTVGEYAISRLLLANDVDDVALTEPTVDAILDEIWNADVNQHLRAAPGRAHVPPEDARTRSLELLADEWIHLPALPAFSAEWVLASVAVGDLSGVDAICARIAAAAQANQQTLPVVGATPLGDGATSIAPETLLDVLYNAQLRATGKADVAYYYVAAPGAIPVDVAPSTPTGGSAVATATATPAWFIPFWHYIDRLRAEALQHCAVFESVVEILAEGKMTVRTLDALDKLSVGNQPGPASLWVAMAKIGFLFELRQLRVAGAGPERKRLEVLHDYVRTLVGASGVPKSRLLEWETRVERDSTGALRPSALQRALAARIKAADDMAGRVQSGPRFMGLLSVLDLWTFYSSLRKAHEDKGVPFAGEVVNAFGSASSFTGAVTSMIAPEKRADLLMRAASALGKSLEAPETASLVEASSKFLGLCAGGAGLVFGVLQVIQGVREDDWTKEAGGAGAVLTSIGYGIDVALTKWGPTLVARVAATDLAAIGIGETALVAVGSTVTWIGVIVTVVAMVGGHRAEIERLAYEAFAPGTEKFFDLVVPQLLKSKAASFGTPAARSAIEGVQASLKQTRFIVWFMSDGAKANLKALGFDDDDVKLLQSVPTGPRRPLSGP